MVELKLKHVLQFCSGLGLCNFLPFQEILIMCLCMCLGIACAQGKIIVEIMQESQGMSRSRNNKLIGKIIPSVVLHICVTT